MYTVQVNEASLEWVIWRGAIHIVGTTKGTSGDAMSVDCGTDGGC